MESETLANKFILVSNGDSYVGYVLARHLVEELNRCRISIKKHWRIRVLCVNRRKLKGLERMGADIQQVDYDSEAIIRKQLHHVKYLVFVPNMGDHRVSQGINILDCAAHHKVRNFSIGVGDAFKENVSFGHYLQLEKYVREKFAYYRWCIFRLGFLHQYFYYWSQMIESSGVIGMPLSEGDIFATVDVQDVCDCVATLLFSPKKQSNPDDDEIGIPERALKRIYQLTGPRNYSCAEMVKLLNKSLEDGEGANVSFDHISLEKMKAYFESIMVLKGKENPQQGLYKPGLLPDPHHYLNASAIDLFLDFMAVVRCRPQTDITNDVRDLSGKDPTDLRTFFRKNNKHFRPSYQVDKAATICRTS
ncbi:hypothetical protein EC973_003157 [Apophysomyces ossiformis]|uniref:NmrA-like domain-containing protein n=1 Tax=Apophysomyces ossiformis TaxID=679940 RepID=A0A8H7EQQ2_9FUNG|nr:hypothetical protein EC973_003157 [Apophysomyces ossiformis]